MQEFQRPALEALPQPLEDGTTAIARAAGHAIFPASVQYGSAKRLGGSFYRKFYLLVETSEWHELAVHPGQVNGGGSVEESHASRVRRKLALAPSRPRGVEGREVASLVFSAAPPHAVGGAFRRLGHVRATRSGAETSCFARC